MFEGSTIIYVNTRKATEEVRNALSRVFGDDVGEYHGGMSQTERNKSQEMFVTEQLSCMVATIAFGMGVDKSNVRTIVHYGAPRSPENYYQEIGRAGRDGQESRCYVFWEPKDFNTHRFFLRDISNAVQRSHQSLNFSKLSTLIG